MIKIKFTYKYETWNVTRSKVRNFKSIQSFKIWFGYAYQKRGYNLVGYEVLPNEQLKLNF